MVEGPTKTGAPGPKKGGFEKKNKFGKGPGGKGPGGKKPDFQKRGNKGPANKGPGNKNAGGPGGKKNQRYFNQVGKDESTKPNAGANNANKKLQKFPGAANANKPKPAPKQQNAASSKSGKEDTFLKNCPIVPDSLKEKLGTYPSPVKRRMCRKYKLLMKISALNTVEKVQKYIDTIDAKPATKRSKRLRNKLVSMLVKLGGTAPEKSSKPAPASAKKGKPAKKAANKPEKMAVEKDEDESDDDESDDFGSDDEFDSDDDDETDEDESDEKQSPATTPKGIKTPAKGATPGKGKTPAKSPNKPGQTPKQGGQTPGKPGRTPFKGAQTPKNKQSPNV